MRSKWETRERNTKRLALMIAVLLHILLFVVISAGSENISVRNLIEHVIGQNQPGDQASTDVKV